MSESGFTGKEKENGFTLVEFLIVVAFTGVLIAIGVSNFNKAKISSNEADAIKAMQTLRDAEAEYFEQNMDGDGVKDYTAEIGDLSASSTLRCPLPVGNCAEKNSLVDDSFEGAFASGYRAKCDDPKSGYCIQFAGDPNADDPSLLQTEFGWEASMTSAYKNGTRDFSVYEDGVIRCAASRNEAGEAGRFEANRMTSPCE